MRKIIISIICVLLMTGCGKKKEPVTSQPEKEETSVVSEQQKEEVTIDHITASYEGDTEEGTFIQKGCKGLTVMAYYSDGTSKETTDYQLSVPTRLEAAKTYTFTIKSRGHSTTFDVTCSTPFDKEAYKDKCESISYDELARYPDKYKGKDIVLYGQVLQVIDGEGKVQMRIATKDSGYGNWYDDVVFAEYAYDNGEGRILEDDMISVYGSYYGLFTYTSTSGSSITVPGIVVKAVGNEAITVKEEETSSADFEEFKKKMDAYEEFFNSYVEFMKSYDATDMSMLTSYIDMLSKYTEAMEALDAIDESTLTPEEDAYYLEVMLRIEKKLLEVINN